MARYVQGKLKLGREARKRPIKALFRKVRAANRESRLRNLAMLKKSCKASIITVQKKRDQLANSAQKIKEEKQTLSRRISNAKASLAKMEFAFAEMKKRGKSTDKEEMQTLLEGIKERKSEIHKAEARLRKMNVEYKMDNSYQQHLDESLKSRAKELEKIEDQLKTLMTEGGALRLNKKD